MEDIINVKTAYSAACRENLIEIYLKYGLDIGFEPQNPSFIGLYLLDYKYRMRQKILIGAENNYAELMTKIEEKDEEHSSMDLYMAYYLVSKDKEKYKDNVRILTRKE